VRIVFDTGAATSILTLEAARRAGIDPKSAQVIPAGQVGGVGRRQFQSWIAPVDVFKIGDEEIRHTHLRIADTTVDDTDMLLGADFFLSHHVYIAKSQGKVYFTYNGGPVFNLTTTPLAAAPSALSTQTSPSAEPTDPEGFARRGAAYADRRDFDHAIADLTKAVMLAPTEARYRFDRARAYQRNNQPFLAMADLNEGLKLDPSDVSALVARAQLEFLGHDRTHAFADLGAVDRLAARQANVRLSLGELYESAAAYTPALAQLDLWILAHPDDSRRAQALDDRCRIRALTGEDLRKALADCNAAVGALPKAPVFLASRGLVHLRLGEQDKAIADFDAALVIAPKAPWALYGRGLAKLKKGLTAEGNADIAAAVALLPGLPAEAKAHGLN
jgi:tetratricopeptide (TPR) repeat protein